MNNKLNECNVCMCKIMIGEAKRRDNLVFNEIFPTIQNKQFAYVFHIKTYIFEFSILVYLPAEVVI